MKLAPGLHNLEHGGGDCLGFAELLMAPSQPRANATPEADLREEDDPVIGRQSAFANDPFQPRQFARARYERDGDETQGSGTYDFERSAKLGPPCCLRFGGRSRPPGSCRTIRPAGWCVATGTGRVGIVEISRFPLGTPLLEVAEQAAALSRRSILVSGWKRLVGTHYGACRTRRL